MLYPVFQHDVIESDEYIVFYEGIVDCIQWVAQSLLAHVTRPETLARISDICLVVGSLGPKKTSRGANCGRYSFPPILTWGTTPTLYETFWRGATWPLPLGDKITFFKMVMLLRDMKSEFSTPEEVVRQSPPRKDANPDPSTSRPCRPPSRHFRRRLPCPPLRGTSRHSSLQNTQIHDLNHRPSDRHPQTAAPSFSSVWVDGQADSASTESVRRRCVLLSHYSAKASFARGPLQRRLSCPWPA